MLILPERDAPRVRALLPMRRAEWRQPSARACIYGIENKKLWRLTVHTHDGKIIWRGFFEDREDCDAFLWAHVTGSLNTERELWRMPTPWWPGFDLDLPIQIAAMDILTSPTGSNQTWNRPADFNASNNSIECVGGGSSGNNTATSGDISHGGGGGYSKIVNFAAAATETYRIGAKGTGVSATSTTSTAGGDSWFSGTTLGGSDVGAQGGQSTTSTAGGTGGASASGTGTTKYSGGNGSASVTGGAGGAAGPAGAGGAGSGTDGGSANNGTTAGPSGADSNGLSGTEWDGTHGCGTGAFNDGAATTQLNGGNYGGGGCGRNGSGTSGEGAQGIVVVTYTPAGGGIVFRRSTQFYTRRF